MDDIDDDKATAAVRRDGDGNTTGQRARSSRSRATAAVAGLAGAGVLAWSEPAFAFVNMQHNESLVHSPAPRRCAGAAGPGSIVAL